MKPVGWQLTPHLSNCAKNYAKVLTNPFGNFSTPPCIPDVISFPSYKIKTQGRGSFFIGTQGLGFVTLRPRMFFNDNVASYRSLAAYASNVIDPSLAGVGVSNNDSPYASTVPPLQFRNWRLVGAGIKIRYTGTELNRGGRVVLARMPSGESFQFPVSDSTLLALRSTNTAPVTRRPESVTYYPDTYNAIDYIEGISLRLEQSLLIAVVGGVVGSSFEYEYVQHWEVIGDNVLNTSKSESDPMGLGAVIQSIPQRVPSTTPEVAENNMLQKALSAISGTFSGMLPTVGRVALNMGMSYLNQNNQPLALANGPIVTDVD